MLFATYQVLCASNPDKSEVELLAVPEGAAIGQRVTWEGHPGEPAAPGPMTKKRVLEKLMQAGKMVINGDGVAVYVEDDGRETPFTLPTGVVKSTKPAGFHVG